MYPSQTSLIPVTVALTRFFETEGFKAFGHNYPYWYLGTTPYKYLTGPVVPLLLSFLHEIISGTYLFTLTIFLVLLSFLLSVVGWSLLVKKISQSNNYYLLAAILLLIFPWRIFVSLSLEEGTMVIARNLIPFVLISFWDYLGQRSSRSGILAVISTSLLFLINTSILPILIVGIISLVLARSYKEGKIIGISKHIKRSFKLLVLSFIVVTLWYTPSYWLTIAFNPSIGGASGIKVILRILDLLKSLTPLVLAVLAVYFSHKIKSKIQVFTLIWILTFGFLTLFRFIGDPDFWQDWTAWFYELEIGIALLISSIICNVSIIKKPTTYYILALILFLLPFYFTWRIYVALGRPVLLTRDVPEAVRSLEKLSGIAGGKTSFLSGSTVFWADALYDIYQVRGGRDQVAVNPYWDKAAYEFREGNNPEKSKEWLEKLSTSYVLVHSDSSREYYHDFKYINKWNEIGVLVWQGNGDVIYQLK
jgi:hypothetical protein